VIVRLRTRAGLYLSGLLLFCGLSLAAQATQPVTRSEMESFVYSTLAVAALATLTGGAGIIAWILARDRSLQREHLAQIITAISELATGLNGAIRALKEHDSDPDAHGAAQRIGHAPILKRLDEIDGRLDGFFVPRDPSDSPVRRRHSDPAGEDHAGERGSR
jgi:hypothetical protein